MQTLHQKKNPVIAPHHRSVEEPDLPSGHPSYANWSALSRALDEGALCSGPAVVLYHGNCPDGFAAAAAAYLALGEGARFIPLNWGGAMPDVAGLAGCHVFVLDFYLPSGLLDELSRSALSVTLLDHHKTAIDDIGGYALAGAGFIHLDTARSGARLAWEYFHGNSHIPFAILAVEARDLGKTAELQNAREFLHWLDIQPRDLEVWRSILTMSQADVEGAITRGKPMSNLFDHMSETVAQKAQPVEIMGQAGLMVSTHYFFSSEVGERLARRSGTFGLLWRVDGPADRQEIYCSLRSIPEESGFMVRTMAEQFGGGGHDEAAGFRLPLSKLPQLIAGRLSLDDRGAPGIDAAAALTREAAKQLEAI